jgi:hypothetical protein
MQHMVARSSTQHAARSSFQRHTAARSSTQQQTQPMHTLHQPLLTLLLFLSPFYLLFSVLFYSSPILFSYSSPIPLLFLSYSSPILILFSTHFLFFTFAFFSLSDNRVRSRVVSQFYVVVLFVEFHNSNEASCKNP